MRNQGKEETFIRHRDAVFHFAVRHNKMIPLHFFYPATTVQDGKEKSDFEPISGWMTFLFPLQDD